MAGLREIAIGIASALLIPQSPEPLHIDLRGQTADDAAFLAMRVIDECADAGVDLIRVAVDPAIVAYADGLPVEGSYRGVRIEADLRSIGRLTFYRKRSPQID